MLASRDEYDVAVLGGGLAGLTLGIQLKRARPDTSILIIERRAGPPPEAAFKVGESTAELASHYFSEVVGMEDHLRDHHYRKAGLRFYFTAGDNSDIARRLEFGPTRPNPKPTYQIDRGLFEAELATRNRQAGVELIDGVRVEDVELSPDANRVVLSRDGQTATVGARWIVDASGRGALLKRKLGLARDVKHDINSAWFRLAGGLDHEQWSDDPAWLERMPERGVRQRGTTHMMGPGYWVWLIQLATGPISIGICADPRLIPFDQISTFDAFLEWARKHEPQLADSLEARHGDVLDFLKVEKFSLGCERLYDPEARWLLTGEAGVFADPFYSPGSDFIATGNTFITDIVRRDLDGEDVGERADYFNDYLMFMFDRYMTLYDDTYPLMGNPELMGIKHSLDVMPYWGEHALIFIKADIADLELLRAVRPAMERSSRLQRRLQDFYLEWDAMERRELPPSIIPKLGPSAVGDRLFALSSEIPADAVRDLVLENAERFEALVVRVFHKTASRLVPRSPIDRETPINPFAISLDPDRWESDGLFGTAEHPGITLQEAEEKAQGLERIYFEETHAEVA
jgi:flavin-dependent dehydrogenase